jgi:hypothetical protein
MQQPDTFTLKSLFTREWFPSLLGSFSLLGAAYLVEHLANNYAFEFALRPTSNHVGDLILDNIPALDLNFLIVEGAFLAIVLGVLYVLSKPRSVLFSLKALALFIIVRAFFISLTHVGIHPEHIDPSLGFFDGIYLYLNFQTGLFFSGHTGLPLLIALIFWENKRARYILVALSAVFGVAVLVAHIHYSIDVFAAPFMVYGIFKIATRLFPRDWALIAPSAAKL